MTPSHAPSLAPTLAPSVAPSMTPSHAPSLAPTLAPTDAPSVAPTRYPTTEDIYKFWIDIELRLSNLTVPDVSVIALEPLEFVETFQTSVEESLVSTDMLHGLESRLQYQSFGSVFESINEYEVNVMENYFDESLTARDLIRQSQP
eukprot:331475_1